MKSHRFAVCILLYASSLSAPACGDDPDGDFVWRLDRVIPALEAHQAAAADEKFVYAITNRLVAKYDRNSGKRIAVSTGEAKHLNSGFFHEKRLLCAHSNYPQIPESSEVKVLDPRTMKVTTFHDFEDYGGSLTWVLRHDRSWWCNFAKYGEKNADTFLARFDDEWQETARWKYPPEVIRQIGSYSLSGGLWRKDALLVTDHDHGMLYQLRVPKDGDVLEFIGQRPAPFTGQGIAVDPATNGLVGINRAKKHIVFATPVAQPSE